jgi:transmembrane sensor
VELEEIKILIAKYNRGTASEEERMQVMKWYESIEGNEPEFAEGEFEAVTGEVKHLLKRYRELELPPEKYFSLWQRIAMVAAAVILIVFDLWFFSGPGQPEANHTAVTHYANDVAPGKNTATLTLADGKVINLSDAKTGVVVGTSGLKYNDGTVVGPLTGSSLREGTTKQPHTSDEIATARAELGSVSRNAPRNDELSAEGKMQMLTASTPRGGQYQITLPDGTRVWLNAESKISFPAQFIGKERKILLLNGEAYFEVTTSYTSLPGTSPSLRGRRTKQSFIVESNGQEVEVLGTHFNINAYGDEGGTKTTLLEGSVKVSSLRAPVPSLRGGTTKQSHDEVATSRRAPRNDDRNNDERGGKWEILKPGQQAVVTANASQIKVLQVDVNDAIAWKNSLFIFDNESLKSIMQRVARWYDVEVIYANDQVGKLPFSGSVSRFKNVSTLLKQLENAGQVKFKIEGRKIMVLPGK